VCIFFCFILTIKKQSDSLDRATVTDSLIVDMIVYNFESAKHEVDCLTKELKSWVEVKAIDEEIDSDCELARFIRSNRSTIFDKKKELRR
jgi:hypothetical protein